MARVRTFIALDPGEAIRERIVALQESLTRSGAEVKWVEPENLHVTLLFLGEVDERDLIGVCRAVGDVTSGVEAFTLSVEGVRCFGDPCRPRTIWVGVGTGAAELVELHHALEDRKS